MTDVTIEQTPEQIQPQQQNTDWRQRFGENAKLFESFSNPNDFITHYQDITKNSIRIPNENATPEQLAEFAVKIGASKDVTEYAKMLEGTEWAGAEEMFYKSGVPLSAAQKMIEFAKQADVINKQKYETENSGYKSAITRWGIETHGADFESRLNNAFTKLEKNGDKNLADYLRNGYENGSMELRQAITRELFATDGYRGVNQGQVNYAKNVINESKSVPELRMEALNILSKYRNIDDAMNNDTRFRDIQQILAVKNKQQ